MRVTGSQAIAKESAVSAMEFAAKDAVPSSKRFCVASGDPHCTNYDGDYFHIQEPGIYTIAISRDGLFEVQEKMRKNGANKVGIPSCMTGAVVRYKQITIEADVANFGKLRVNGMEMDLKRDETVKYGGVSIRYGKQTVEWRDEKSSAVGLKMSTLDGFGVLITGGYCGVLETNVPTSYYGKMGGICGNADGVKNAADYFSPDGTIMDVNRGAKRWEMSGYNGPKSPLSKWQLAWKPIESQCYFASGCEKNQNESPIRSKTTNVDKPKSVHSEPVHSEPVHSKTVHSEHVHSEPVPDNQFTTSKGDVIGSLNSMNTRIISIIRETQTLQAREIEQNKNNMNISQTELDSFIMKQDDEQKQLQRLHASILKTNASITHHYEQMIADSLYLHKLDLIKPQFLQTLDATNSNFAALSDHVSKLMYDEHKQAMLDILTRAQNQTIYDTRDLAQAFLAHYEKYKHVLRADSSAYKHDLTIMKELNEQYVSGQTVYFGLKAEVAKLRALLKSLKNTIIVGENESQLFSQIETIISEILSSRKTRFATDGANKECAASVLRSHVANGLV